MEVTEINREPWFLLAAIALLGALVLALLALVLHQGRKLARARQTLDEESRKRIDRSRSVLLGQVAEHFAPLLPGFPWDLKDARFMGGPVDFVVFSGMNSSPGQMEVVFCEIKTGTAGLNAAEKAVKDAVDNGRVRFEVLRLEADGSFARSGKTV